MHFVLFNIIFLTFSCLAVNAQINSKNFNNILLEETISHINIAIKNEKKIHQLEQKVEEQEKIILSYKYKAKIDPYVNKKLSFKRAILTDTSGVNNKKHSFVAKLLDFSVLSKDISIRPYFGIGYAFNAGVGGNANSYNRSSDNDLNVSSSTFGSSLISDLNPGLVAPSQDTSPLLPKNIFNQFGGIIGFVVNDKILFEFSAFGTIAEGSKTATSSSSTTIISSFSNSPMTSDYNFTFTGNSMLSNVFRFTTGYIFDEEIFGKYGDKNKIILLAGIAIGLYKANIITTTNVLVSTQGPWDPLTDIRITNYQSTLVSPEAGIAYERYIVDHLSLRIEARMNALGANNNMALNGTMMTSILFHI